MQIKVYSFLVRGAGSAVGRMRSSIGARQRRFCRSGEPVWYVAAVAVVVVRLLEAHSGRKPARLVIHWSRPYPATRPERMLPQTCAWHCAVMNGAAGCLNGDSVPACRHTHTPRSRSTSGHSQVGLRAFSYRDGSHLCRSLDRTASAILMGGEGPNPTPNLLIHPLTAQSYCCSAIYIQNFKKNLSVN